MLRYLVETMGGWLGVSAPVSLQIAEGVLLAGIILSVVWFVIVLIAAAVLRRD
jgi:phage-related minor tail protein